MSESDDKNSVRESAKRLTNLARELILHARGRSFILTFALINVVICLFLLLLAKNEQLAKDKGRAEAAVTEAVAQLEVIGITATRAAVQFDITITAVVVQGNATATAGVAQGNATATAQAEDTATKEATAPTATSAVPTPTPSFIPTLEPTLTPTPTRLPTFTPTPTPTSTLPPTPTDTPRPKPTDPPAPTRPVIISPPPTRPAGDGDSN